MKALSLTQPWADVILEQGKRIENREKWTACKYRGPVLLHAAKGLGSRSDVLSRLAFLLKAGVPREWIDERFEERPMDGRGALASSPYHRPMPSLRLGGIVGRAEIVGVIKPHVVPAMRGDREFTFDEWVERGGDADQRRWWFGGFALVLDKVEPLPFVPWVGALGLFEVPDDYATRAA